MPIAERTNPRRRAFAQRLVTPTLAVALAAAALLAFAPLGDAVAGPVRGRVSGHEKLVPEVYAEAAKPDARRYTWREPSPTVRAEFRNLSANPSRDLCIAALGQGNAPPHEPILVRVTGGHTIPTTLVVSPGTRLSFENRDPFPHRLYGTGQAATMKAETMNAAGRREWTAPPGQGRFEFRDELAPSLRFFVMVEPQVAEIAYPGRDGAFTMNLPTGEFTLQAFFNGRRVGRAVNVTAKDKVLVELKDPLAVGEGGDAK